VFSGGSAADPGEAYGTVSMSDEMLERGAGEYDATAFAAEVERLAISLGSHTSETSTSIGLDAHTDRLEAGLDLLADMVLRPRFDESTVNRLKEIRLGEIAEASDDGKVISGWTMDELYFGKGHPIAHPIIGTIESVKNLSPEGLKLSWETRLGPDRATFVVVGDVQTTPLLESLEARFGTWEPTGNPVKDIPAPPVHSGDDRFFFVDKPGTSQTSLRIMMSAPAMNDPAQEPAELGSIVLGGTFTSRLNRLLREEKGYTYGARASTMGRNQYGYLEARTNVQREVSAPALSDLLAELQRYSQGIDEAELAKAKGAWQTQTVAAMESRGSIASSFAALAANGLKPSDLQENLSAAMTADTDSVNKAITKSNLDHAIILVVGDLAEIQTDIEKAVPASWQVIQLNE
jgi:predicted Zn-dependent peptidase